MTDSIPEFGNTLKVIHDQAKAAYDKEKSRVTKASQGFESIFIGMMLKQMRKSMTGDNGVFGKSSESKLYQDMMDEALAQQMSTTGTFGLANAMVKSLEHTLPPNPTAPSAPKRS